MRFTGMSADLLEGSRTGQRNVWVWNNSRVCSGKAEAWEGEADGQGTKHVNEKSLESTRLVPKTKSMPIGTAQLCVVQCSNVAYLEHPKQKPLSFGTAT